MSGKNLLRDGYRFSEKIMLNNSSRLPEVTGAAFAVHPRAAPSQLPTTRLPAMTITYQGGHIMTVLIAGGGIGGLTLALSLHSDRYSRASIRKRVRR